MKDQDMFGHYVGLNFRKEGETHNTKCGGFVSVGLKIAMIVYIAQLLQKLFTHGSDAITVNEFLASKDEHYEDSVDYKNTHFIMTPTLMTIDEEGD